jgi:hypothetical protein
MRLRDDVVQAEAGYLFFQFIQFVPAPDSQSRPAETSSLNFILIAS